MRVKEEEEAKEVKNINAGEFDVRGKIEMTNTEKYRFLCSPYQLSKYP